jgi:hypothetical protein
MRMPIFFSILDCLLKIPLVIKWGYNNILRGRYMFDLNKTILLIKDGLLDSEAT